MPQKPFSFKGIIKESLTQLGIILELSIKQNSGITFMIKNSWFLIGHLQIGNIYYLGMI
jgi:hypothetical protein